MITVIGSLNMNLVISTDDFPIQTIQAVRERLNKMQR